MDVVNGTILVLITLIVLPIAGVAFARSGPLWSSIGRGPLSIDEDLPPRAGRGPAAPIDPAIQAAEARQMLEAKSYRRERRGEGSLDIEAEVARVLEPGGAPPGVDEELRAEVRRLVIAKNERRLRRGEPELDVERETERQLADFIRSG
jgi:hypothetical protein